MTNNINHIVVAANPFGFGPTGNAIPILEELNARFFDQSDIRIYFVGSDKCQIIAPDLPGVRRVFLNERDEIALGDFLRTLSGRVFVLGVQNRFIVAVGKALGCKTAFFDVLAWMWSEIPETHLVADEIFWMRFPGIIERQYHRNCSGKNIHIIEGVYKRALHGKTDISANKKVLFCIGGGFSPLRDGIQENYLSLLAAVLKASILSRMDVVIVAGESVATFLRDMGARPVTWRIFTLSHAETLKHLSSAEFFLSIGGQSSTMEALLSGIPIYFFIPSNLSQVLLQMRMASEIKRDDILWWKDEFAELVRSSGYLSEKDYIERMEVISGDIVSDSKNVKALASKFDDFLENLLGDESYFSELESIRKWIGSNGSTQIVDYIETWL
jgi:hypothetical protein